MFSASALIVKTSHPASGCKATASGRLSAGGIKCADSHSAGMLREARLGFEMSPYLGLAGTVGQKLGLAPATVFTVSELETLHPF